MGREVKRVIAGFDWPMEKTWSGFLQPSYPERRVCPDCEGGYSKEYKALQSKWYGYTEFKPEERGSTPIPYDHPKIVAMAKRNAEGYGWVRFENEAKRLADMLNGQWCHHLNADDVYALMRAKRLSDFTHTWTPGKGSKKKDPPYYPTPKEVNDWSIGGMGHDSINCWIVIKAELHRLRLPSTCPICKGKGEMWSSQKAKRRCAAWRPKEPPKGDWWQVWETVSEGSAVTPAFATRAELVNYLVKYGDAWDQKRGDGGWTRENAESFVEAAWAPSMIGHAGKLHQPRDGAL